MPLPPDVPINQLTDLLKKIDGAAFYAYRRLAGLNFRQNHHCIYFQHIQGSPGAFPASVCLLQMTRKALGLSDHCSTNAFRKLATADYLLRALNRGIHLHTRRNRGAQGSGAFQPLQMPPQILKRNLVRLSAAEVQIAFRVSLPGSSQNRVLGGDAIAMFTEELPAIVTFLKTAATDPVKLKRHCDNVEDFFYLQERLEKYNLVAFIADGAVLPRKSGISQHPLKEDAVAFKAPPELALTVELPNTGTIRGMGIRPGVNVIIGSGFHGKSTLLNALVKSIYPHTPGDGREQVVAHPAALYITAEEGRSISGVDISPFIPELPGKSDPRCLNTRNASSSTAQAAAVVEAVAAGAKLLLLDEDTSATNFLIRDHLLRQLIPEDHSTPFYDRVRQLYEQFGVSTLIVVGGSSEYLGVAHHVTAMRRFQPVCMDDAVGRLSLPEPFSPHTPLKISDTRQIHPHVFNPSYNAERFGKTIAVRIKPLRLAEKILEYGNEQLDLQSLSALVDPDQVLAVGYALLLARREFERQRLSPSELAGAISRHVEAKGLDVLSPEENSSLFFAAFRPLELAGAINRYRELV